MFLIECLIFNKQPDNSCTTQGTMFGTKRAKAAIIKTAAFWVMMQYSFVDGFQCFI
jgi:hypothetical protein